MKIVNSVKLAAHRQLLEKEQIDPANKRLWPQGSLSLLSADADAFPGMVLLIATLPVKAVFPLRKKDASTRNSHLDYVLVNKLMALFTRANGFIYLAQQGVGNWLQMLLKKARNCRLPQTIIDMLFVSLAIVVCCKNLPFLHYSHLITLLAIGSLVYFSLVQLGVHISLLQKKNKTIFKHTIICV